MNDQGSAENLKSKRPYLLLVVLAMTAVLVVVVVYFFYFRSSADPRGAFAPKSSESANIENPIDFFYEHFASKDYRVRIINEQNEGLVFYYQKGVLVRIDGEGKYNSKATHIIKGGNLYSINATNKTFEEMSVDDPKSVYVLSLLKRGSVLDPIIQRGSLTETSWILVPGDSDTKDKLEYTTTGRRLASHIPEYFDLVDMKIVLDPSSRLITSASVKLEKSSDWDTVKFQYEEVGDIEFLKNFPKDYRKVDPA